MVRPEQSKVAAIQTFEVSNTKKEMETLLVLQLIIFCFVQKFSTLAAPIIDLNRKWAPVKVVWDYQYSHKYVTL